MAVSITGYSLYAVSLLTLTAISVDRLLALLLRLRYRQVVTLKRVCLIHSYFLRFVPCLFNNAIFLEFRYKVRVCNSDRYLTVSSNLGFLLHEDFLHPSSTSKSSARPCSTTQPNKSTEHNAISKSSVQFTVAAIHVSRHLHHFLSL